MKKIIRKMKNIRFGKAQPLVEAAGGTAFILLVMVLLHPLYAAVAGIAYYGFVLMVILRLWSQALSQYQYA